MEVLIVHNSDEVKAVFGGTYKSIVKKVLNSEFGEDIKTRLEEDWDEEDGPLKITLDMITQLYHDGDSEDGYALMELQ